MQNEFKDLIRVKVESLNEEFVSMVSGHYCKKNTGEIFTQTEVTKYMKMSIEKYTQTIMSEIKKEALSNDIITDQRLINDRSKNPKKKNKIKTKETYSNGDEFNMIFRKGIDEFMSIKLDVNEKLTFYVLRDLVTYPTNCVMINEEIPTAIELSPFIGLSERKIRDCLKTLESHNIIKLIQSGHRKAIYVNPQYCASGREMDIKTLTMFGLLECDDEKVNSYLED